MQSLWGLHIIGALLIIIRCNRAFVIPSSTSDLIKQNLITNETPNEPSSTSDLIKRNLITNETPNEPSGNVDNLLISAGKLEDALHGQPNEVESTVYIVDDVPNVQFKIVKEQNSENNEQIINSDKLANDPAQVQDVHHISKSANKLQYRSQRSIPEEEHSSGGHHGSHHSNAQNQGQMAAPMNGNMQYGGGLGGLGMGGLGMGGLGMGGLGMGGLGMGGLGMGGLGMGGLGMGGLKLGGYGMGGMGGLGLGGMGMPMGGMGMGAMGLSGLGLGGMGMPMGGMGMGGFGMGGLGAGGLGGMPPAAYVPAPGGGIIPAIPPSTFIPPPPMPFPGAYGPHGFPGHAVGFPIMSPSFAGGPLIGG